MRERRARQERRRVREFDAFVAGAGGRLLHAAALLTGEPDAPSAAPSPSPSAVPSAAPPSAPEAERLLVAALARTFADWERLRGEDPYERTRQELSSRFSRTAWRHRRDRGGLLGGLPPQERLVLVLRLFEGVAEEQTAALLGLSAERVRGLCLRGMAAVLSAPGGAVRPVGRRVGELSG